MTYNYLQKLGPKHVFVVVEVRVDQLAVLVATCVACKFLVPCLPGQVALVLNPIVRVLELLREQRLVGERRVVSKYFQMLMRW